MKSVSAGWWWGYIIRWGETRLTNVLGCHRSEVGRYFITVNSYATQPSQTSIPLHCILQVSHYSSSSSTLYLHNIFFMHLDHYEEPLINVSRLNKEFKSNQNQMKLIRGYLMLQTTILCRCPTGDWSWLSEIHAISVWPYGIIPLSIHKVESLAIFKSGISNFKFK